MFYINYSSSSSSIVILFLKNARAHGFSNEVSSLCKQNKMQTYTCTNLSMTQDESKGVIVLNRLKKKKKKKYTDRAVILLK